MESAHFVGPQSTSDRTEPEEDSPVYTTRADKFRVYRFPWRQESLFPSKHSRVAIAIRENTFKPANVRRIYTPTAPLAGRGGTQTGPRRRGFFDHEPKPAAVPIESARKTTQREDLEVGAEGSGRNAVARRASAFAGCQRSHFPNYMARAGR